MSALILSSVIGTLTGLNGRLVSWICGGVFITVTAFAGVLTAGFSPQTLALFFASILGYNVGLTIAMAVLFRRETTI